MLEALIDGQKRPPKVRGERTSCPDCGSILIAVMPFEIRPHWRHEGRDCDSWSEPEGQWHIEWKELFDRSCRETTLRDPLTDEHHRADILVCRDTPYATVLELQHSSISYDEISAREAFYKREHRMFWLVHIHNEKSSLGYNFFNSLDLQSCLVKYKGNTFAIMQWMGRSTQFIEKWKRATAHVFFQAGAYIFYLASPIVAKNLGRTFGRGEYALCQISQNDFLDAVHCKNRSF